MSQPNEESDFGTFCGVIGEQLVVSSCPLPKGTCMWKHRLHGLCMFTADDLTPDEFAKRVGLPPLEAPVVNILRSTIQYKIKHELAP